MFWLFVILRGNAVIYAEAIKFTLDFTSIWFSKM